MQISIEVGRDMIASKYNILAIRRIERRSFWIAFATVYRVLILVQQL